jgi:hypothetical protein
MATVQGSDSLKCPTCGATYPENERFCPDCRVPLIRRDESAATHRITERQQRARKIKPQLAEGPLVRVAGARNQAEGEFIQGLLLEEGVPSMLRRTAGFDVPDFLAAGPRDVMVPQTGFAAAREILLEAELISPEPVRATVSPVRLAVGLLVALAFGALVVWIGIALLHR